MRVGTCGVLLTVRHEVTGPWWQKVGASLLALMMRRLVMLLLLVLQALLMLQLLPHRSFPDPSVG